MRQLFLLTLLLSTFSINAAEWTLVAPSPIMDKLENRFELDCRNPDQAQSILINGKAYELIKEEEGLYVEITLDGETELLVEYMGEKQKTDINPIPLWLSIFPPLLAIILALVFREVLVSLFIGIAFGSILISTYDVGFTGIFIGFARIMDSYLIDALLDSGHISIIVFSMIIGALVALVSKNGGMKGVVDIIARFARNARSGQFATYLLGIVIFFDDYANTLVVGNTMRPVTDRLGISREKLSYIVDSTAAPVASIAFITTWIGAELSYLGSGISQIPEMQGKESPYGIFLGSLQYAYYPILTLAFIFMIIYLRRDFGPMWSAEMKSSAEQKSLEQSPVEELEEQEPKEKIRWYNAVLPIASLIIVAIIGLVVTGYDGLSFEGSETAFQKLAMIIGNADSYKALLWASLSGLGLALIMTISQRIMDLESSIKAIVNGFESLLPAILILVLAWTLTILTEDLRTAGFLSTLLRGQVSPVYFPLITFILSALVSFATGSSWGTMAILYPLMLGTSWALGQEFGFDYAENMAIFSNVTASILAGSVLGDHCSPISDTTILSSLATKTNHIQHVRTQMPYALTVGSVAGLLGILPAALGVPWWILFPICILCLFLIVRYLGKKVETL